LDQVVKKSSLLIILPNLSIALAWLGLGRISMKPVTFQKCVINSGTHASIFRMIGFFTLFGWKQHDEIVIRFEDNTLDYPILPVWKGRTQGDRVILFKIVDNVRILSTFRKVRDHYAPVFTGGYSRLSLTQKRKKPAASMHPSGRNKDQMVFRWVSKLVWVCPCRCSGRILSLRSIIPVEISQVSLSLCPCFSWSLKIRSVILGFVDYTEIHARMLGCHYAKVIHRGKYP